MEQVRRIIWDERMRPCVVEDEELLERPTLKPNKDGTFGKVAYTAVRVRLATMEELWTWNVIGLNLQSMPK